MPKTRTTPPAPPTDTRETAEAANRRLAAELNEANNRINALEGTNDDYVEEIDDLRGIVRREHLYHKLRAEELARDLHNCGIEV